MEVPAANPASIWSKSTHSKQDWTAQDRQSSATGKTPYSHARPTPDKEFIARTDPRAKTLPTVLRLWTGRNKGNCPGWAKQPGSIDTICQSTQFTTTTDQQQTVNTPGWKYAPINGVNALSTLELSFTLDSYDGPDQVIFKETSRDKETGVEQRNTLTFPFSLLSSMILFLRQIGERSFGPAVDDSSRASSVLWENEITQMATVHRIEFNMILAVISWPGTTGVERQIRITKNNNQRRQTVMFPWIHLPRILPLIRGLYDEAQTAREQSLPKFKKTQPPVHPRQR